MASFVMTRPELSSKIKVARQDKTAAIKNCKIVIKIGSFPFENFATATIWEANKNPLKIANASPKIASFPLSKTDPPFPPVMDTKYIPIIQKTAAIKLNLSGLFLWQTRK